PTTTTVTSSANPSVLGQNVTFTATVAAIPPGNIPVGTVQFVIDGLNAGAPVTLNGSGVATFSTSTLSIGNHPVVANYSGNSSFTPSSGTLAGGQVVGKANTTTTVTAAPVGPSVFGQAVTFTATIAVEAPGAGTPTGTVSFNIDGNIYCANTPLTGLTAACTQAGLPALPAGTRNVVAIYNGDANFNGSAGTLNYGVNKAATTTTITSDSPDPSLINQPYTVTFTVVPNPVQVNSGTPTGSVTVNDGTGGTCTGTVAAGSCQMTSTTTGNKTLVASYGGDTNFLTSMSAGVQHVVNVSISGTVRNGLTMAPIAGVSVTLFQLPGGTPITSATTDASGVYTITGQFTTPVAVRPTVVAPPYYDPALRNIASLTNNVTGQDFLSYATVGDIPRNLRFVTQYVTPGDAGSMPVILNSLDNEVSVAFSITYDTNLFAQPPTFVCGAQAPGCTITHNTSVFGSVGVTIIPAGGVFARTNEGEAPEAAGLKEIARMNFQTAITANVPATTIGVTGNPTAAAIFNAEGNPLLWSVTLGNVVFQLGREGDVAGRNSGNGTFEAADVVQARRFVTGLDTALVNTANEFQRADTAPAASKGDGVLNATDVIQTRRYVASLDATQSSGGPGLPNPAPIAPPSVERPSELAVGDASATNGARISVPIKLTTNGTELASSFIVRYDERRLTDPNVELGSGAPEGVTLTVNKDEPGLIRVLIDSARAFGKLDDETLLDIQFDVTSEASSGAALVEIEDLVFSNAEARATGSKAQRGAITIAGPNPMSDDKGAKARDRERNGNIRAGSNRRTPDIVEEWLNPSVVVLRSRIEK
ncbi:MAG: Ig-like domain repeat protein, partial [Pyrinomonadaceae bacterium]